MTSPICFETSVSTPPFSSYAPFSTNAATYSVRVKNISDKAHPDDVVAIFSTLIGDIRTFETRSDSSGTYLEISFNNQDTLKKALCMNGYFLSGTSLSVTPSENRMSPKPYVQTAHHNLDDRRNLYVLGLSFNLTKNELTGLFSQYGKVAHCVILATVDNSSRRRGFVVMSTHEEAKSAMTNLTGTQFKGYVLDVSWAVVQRSKGFLDGGDRLMMVDNRPQYITSPAKLQSSFAELPGLCSGTEDFNLASVTRSHVPTTSLHVTGLPALLFGQKQDLSPLFYPFGDVKKLEIITTSQAEILSAFVQYTSVLSAREAKESLHGQIYGDSAIEVHFVETTHSGSCFDFTSEISRSAAAPFSQRNINAPSRRELHAHSLFSGFPCDSRSESSFARHNSFPTFQSRYYPSAMTNSSLGPYGISSNKRFRYANLRNSADSFPAFRTFSCNNIQFGQVSSNYHLKPRHFSA